MGFCVRVGPRLGVAACLAVALWSCGRASAPTGPSALRTPSESSVVVSAVRPSAGVTSTTWECLAAAHTGIFAPAGCPAAPTSRPLTAFAASAPGTPSALASSLSGNTLTLTWVAPGSSDAPLSYFVDAGSQSGLSDVTSFDTGSTATLLVVTSVPNGTYYVRVRARNAAGTSDASNEVVITVGTPPCSGAPGPPTNLQGSASGTTVTLTWTAPAGGCPATAYQVEAGSSSGASDLANTPTGSSATTFSSGGVPAGTYYVRIRALNGNGSSGSSNEVVIIVGGGAPNLTGRWLGLTPDGFVSPPDPVCGIQESDASMTLTQNGSSFTGTLTLTVRRDGCGDVGATEQDAVSGTMDGTGTISFTARRTDKPSTGGVGCSGTLVTANRMTGTCVISPSLSESFALSRQ